ncbi:MAG TPA: hypothetical protein VGO25_10045, partial [Rhodanobacteraceae bacterium]|nr:hypothetical protein [Rhodanobacteraceae bacterium]
MGNGLLRHLWCLALLFASAAVSLHAAEPPFLLAAGDKSGGEEEAISRRIEWFMQTRGLDAHPEARNQRAMAVANLRRQVAAGVPALLADESWQTLGPDGMTMLNWDMGNVIGRVTALAVDPADESHMFL